MTISLTSVMSTILLVDDDPAILVAWGRLLRLRHYHVATASDGGSGLVAAGDLRPDLIVTDRAMPGMDGIEFCRRLKRDPTLARIPVVSNAISS
jgi:CheY-like chemotaxis protein